jgi:hypothetical protein
VGVRVAVVLRLDIAGLVRVSVRSGVGSNVRRAVEVTPVVRAGVAVRVGVPVGVRTKNVRLALSPSSGCPYEPRQQRDAHPQEGSTNGIRTVGSPAVHALLTKQGTC